MADATRPGSGESDEVSSKPTASAPTSRPRAAGVSSAARASGGTRSQRVGGTRTQGAAPSKPAAPSLNKPSAPSVSKPSAPSARTAAKAPAKAGARTPGKASGTRPGASRPAGGKSGGRPPTPPAKRKASTSIVDRPQRQWGLIVTTVVIVLFAFSVIGYAVIQGRDDSNKATSVASVAPATATVEDIAKIEGITSNTTFTRNHSTAIVDYGTNSPPFGGDHSPYWAQCTGIVYPNPIANENAVHPLEHGAIWITYKPGIAQTDIDILAKKVKGINYMEMSPYPGLKTNVSLQAWGYQLFVDSASDPRIDQFITALRLNKNTTPEFGASCDDPAFKADKSTPGHPFEG
jgi:hypothetical protein